ncbi:hypothetical protein U1Q18_038562 [Sarracenia purpurea var. burkii]
MYYKKWSAIATHLPKRTDNEIKNYWNTHLKKRLTKMGIDPVTHKPKNDALLSSDGQNKNAANLSHMAQWESARLEAEARLVRQSKLRSNSLSHQLGLPPLEFSPASVNKSVAVAAPNTPPRCLDILKAWSTGVWTKPIEVGGGGRGGGSGSGSVAGDLESPTSTLSFAENAIPPIPTTGIGESSTAFIEFVGNSNSCEGGIAKEEEEEDWKGLGNPTHLPEFKDGIENSVPFASGIHEMTVSSTMEGVWNRESPRIGSNENVYGGNFMKRFTDLLLNNNSGDHHRSVSEGGGRESDSGGSSGGGGSASGSGSAGSDYYEDNKNYWNSILDLVNSSPSNPPMF